MRNSVAQLVERRFINLSHGFESRPISFIFAKITYSFMKGVNVMFEIIVKRPGDESLFIFKTFDEFLEWWPREKEIWPEAIILDIKRA